MIAFLILNWRKIELGVEKASTAKINAS